MTNVEAQQLLFDHGFGRDLASQEDAIDIGINLGFIGLKSLGVEPAGHFSEEDIIQMRQKGVVIFQVGFGQAIFETIPLYNHAV